jgi:hypothetical protein
MTPSNLSCCRPVWKRSTIPGGDATSCHECIAPAALLLQLRFPGPLFALVPQTVQLFETLDDHVAAAVALHR